MSRCERCWDEGVYTPIPEGARWCDPCASEDDDPAESEPMPEDWADLERELDELERTNPEVRRAAEALERAKRKILRPRHIATEAGGER